MKQKLSYKRKTEDDLVGADVTSVLILWTKLFLEYPEQKCHPCRGEWEKKCRPEG
jgi:hypothetical protein